MRIRLTKHFAEMIDGVDLSNVRTGDVIDVGAREANLLIAEGWAQPIDEVGSSRGRGIGTKRTPRIGTADDGPRRRPRRPA
jgi:hypothetical protein